MQLRNFLSPKCLATNILLGLSIRQIFLCPIGICKFRLASSNFRIDIEKCTSPIGICSGSSLIVSLITTYASYKHAVR